MLRFKETHISFFSRMKNISENGTFQNSNIVIWNRVKKEATITLSSPSCLLMNQHHKHRFFFSSFWIYQCNICFHIECCGILSCWKGKELYWDTICSDWKYYSLDRILSVSFAVNTPYVVDIVNRCASNNEHLKSTFIWLEMFVSATAQWFHLNRLKSPILKERIEKRWTVSVYFELTQCQLMLH